MLSVGNLSNPSQFAEGRGLCSNLAAFFFLMKRFHAHLKNV